MYSVKWKEALPQESYLQKRKGIVKECNMSKVRRFLDIFGLEWQTWTKCSVNREFIIHVHKMQNEHKPCFYLKSSSHRYFVAQTGHDLYCKLWIITVFFWEKSFIIVTNEFLKSTCSCLVDIIAIFKACHPCFGVYYILARTHPDSLHVTVICLNLYLKVKLHMFRAVHTCHFIRPPESGFHLFYAAFDCLWHMLMFMTK